MLYDWSRPGAPEENLAKAKDFVKQASRKKAKVVIFSEYFLGNIPVEELPNEQIVELQGQARRSRINIVCGVTRNRVSEHPRQQYLSSVVIGRRGELLGMVNKSVYYPTERPWFDPVESVEPIEIDGVMVGVLAGFDGTVPDVAKLLVEKGAEVLLYQMSATSPKEQETLQAVAITRAYENTVPVAAVAQLGEFMKKQCIGGSIAVMPTTVKFGVMETADGVDVLAQMEEEEGVEVVEFNLRQLRAMRKKFSHRNQVPEGLD
jgi:predicted amidohydrolase